jgi:hypothetical protein
MNLMLVCELLEMVAPLGPIDRFATVPDSSERGLIIQDRNPVPLLFISGQYLIRTRDTLAKSALPTT